MKKHRTKLWGNLGWYGGNPFCLVRIAVLDTGTWGIGIFELQIAKFVVAIGLYREAKR